jgi:hypothetical protein
MYQYLPEARVGGTFKDQYRRIIAELPVARANTYWLRADNCRKSELNW